MATEEALALLPADKRAGMQALVTALAAIPNVRAVVLGGSYARGTQHAQSDVDLGIYYREAAPFSIDAVTRVAESCAVAPPTVTDFYAWGRWVNGGAWIRTAFGKVDFLYRNLDQVERTVAAAQEGRMEHDYEQQPAYGFYSVIYLAETQICRPLHDPAGEVARLEAQVAVYPPALRERVVQSSLWSAEFTLLFARDFAAKGDVYNTAGCLTRACANLTQALFALNERYFLSDKRVMELIAAFPRQPANYEERISSILAAPGGDASALSSSVAALDGVWHDTVALTAGRYHPQFSL